ncbi:MAG: hypothetical protein BGP25_00975 [Lysobacterales bacterium 63-13]|nr:MAG: hypothetical protein BGP25_00975 [Xanthomonadales bacterium 63-13]
MQDLREDAASLRRRCGTACATDLIALEKLHVGDVIKQTATACRGLRAARHAQVAGLLPVGTITRGHVAHDHEGEAIGAQVGAELLRIDIPEVEGVLLGRLQGHLRQWGNRPRPHFHRRQFPERPVVADQHVGIPVADAFADAAGQILHRHQVTPGTSGKALEAEIVTRVGIGARALVACTARLDG